MTRRKWLYWPAAIVVVAVLAYGIVEATDSGRPVPAVAGVDEGGPAPAGVGEGMHIYFGTTHTHTGADNNHGKDDSGPGDVFAAAKKRGFDFLFLTEHSGHTGPADKAAFYADARHQADLATDDKFVGLAGYEYSDNGGDGDTSNGHITGYGTDDFVDADAPGMDFQRLDDYLVRQSRSHPVIAGFNHPGAAGHGASAERFLTTATRDLFVMTEVHNHDITKNHDLAHAQGMIVELDRGWRVGPTCGIDSHGIYSLVKARPGRAGRASSRRR